MNEMSDPNKKLADPSVSKKEKQETHRKYKRVIKAVNAILYNYCPIGLEDEHNWFAGRLLAQISKGASAEYLFYNVNGYFKCDWGVKTIESEINGIIAAILEEYKKEGLPISKGETLQSNRALFFRGLGM